MKILGFSGGFNVVSTDLLLGRDRLSLPWEWNHDSAAVLLENGSVAFAIEEERLVRTKHVNTFPLNSIHSCLKATGITLKDVDYFSYYNSEASLERLIWSLVLDDSSLSSYQGGRALLAALFKRCFDYFIDPDQFVFVEHHLAHAASAFSMSGFQEALVVTLDGVGEDTAGSVSVASAGKYTKLADIPIQSSLGIFYWLAIRHLGYTFFDEYKVMGLAPYGDPARYRHIFDQTCRCLPEGKFSMVSIRDLDALFVGIFPPRRSGEAFTQNHKDFAAALQETLERLVLHMMTHYRNETGMENLCLAGGVAHNCSATGRLLRSGMFAKIFVQPAAHDAGCALGAAIMAHQNIKPDQPVHTSKHVFLGSDIGSDSDVLDKLQQWSDFIEIQPSPAIAKVAAKLIAEGAVLGWVQGQASAGRCSE
jgi:carbamoyltransferase